MVSWLDRLKRALDPKRRAHKANVRAYKKAYGKTAVTEFDDMSTDPLFLDFGGYHGEWAAAMIARHGGTCHVFEAHPGFAAMIAERFAGDPRIIVHAAALGSEAGTITLSDDADASSALKVGAGAIECAVEPAAPFMASLGDAVVDVAKFNIEGGEYDLLPALAAAGALPGIRHLLIQFHDFDQSHPQRRDAIRATLAKTHDCVWNYPFVWECWQRKKHL